jgi:hypothetical protein
MITEIRLSQIKDTYTGNEDVLIPLINILKESYRSEWSEEGELYFFRSLKEAIVVHKSKEWIPEMQVYEPLPCFSYLVRALKLIVPESREQSRVEVMIKIVKDMTIDKEIKIETALLESSKLKVLISKGDKFINAYANNIINQENLSTKLSVFAELINNAEVDNGAE